MTVPTIGLDQETYQLVIIMSMLFVNTLKTFGMYKIKKAQDPTITFNYAYVISAILGVFVGYVAFLPLMTENVTYIELFMQSGFYAIGANLIVDLAGKSVPK